MLAYTSVWTLTVKHTNSREERSKVFESVTVMMSNHDTDPHTDLTIKQVHITLVYHIIFSRFFVWTDARIVEQAAYV